MSVVSVCVLVALMENKVVSSTISDVIDTGRCRLYSSALFRVVLSLISCVVRVVRMLR